MLLALTRAVAPAIDRCELTHLARQPIDYARAVEEHDAYEAALAHAGCRVVRLPDLPDHPDSVFVEDAAIVFDEIALIARPGAETRRGEVASVAEALRPYRRLAFIQPPATLDGGDVLVTPGRIFVGMSGRTNDEGVRQLSVIVAALGFETTPVPVTGCLHLKSAVTIAGNSAGGTPTLVVNPRWVDVRAFGDVDLIDVDPSEPAAANVLRIGHRVICAAEHPRTRATLEAAGFVTLSVPAGELAKAEGGVTCGSLVFAASNPYGRKQFLFLTACGGTRYRSAHTRCIPHAGRRGPAAAMRRSLLAYAPPHSIISGH
jgi:dimethylargininase